MGEIGQHGKVRLFAGVLYSDEGLFQKSIEELKTVFGGVFFESPVFEFAFTEYYEKEMGKELKKVFIGFEDYVDPEKLADIKLYTNHIEDSHCSRVGGDLKRRINIDPGYVDLNNVVLASTKNRSHRIYIGQGIYMEVTLIFKGTRCEPFLWTYPDFRTFLASKFFLKLRKSL